jgi:hypothetical protein
MKEIHAYLNEDGTYRVEVVGCAIANGELKEITYECPRAKITVEPLAAIGSDEICTIIVKENSNDD